MAQPDPEGTVWFERSLLKTSIFDPEDATQFYSTILVETYYNHYVKKRYYVSDVELSPRNPRAGKQIWNGTAVDAISRYKYANFMYGNSENDIRRHHKVHGSHNYSDMFRTPMMGIFTVPACTEDERYLYMDLTYPIKAIYFPMSHHGPPRYQGHSLYVQLNFTALQQIRIERLRGAAATTIFTFGVRVQSSSLHWTTPRDKVKGLGVHENVTIRFDMKELYNLLILPREKRIENPWTHLRMVSATSVKCRDDCVYTESGMQDGELIKLVDLINNNYGVSLDYPEVSDSVIVGILKSAANVALGLIPIAGPLLAIGSDFMFEAVENPKKFIATYSVPGEINGINIAEGLRVAGVGILKKVRKR